MLNTMYLSKFSHALGEKIEDITRWRKHMIFIFEGQQP